MHHGSFRKSPNSIVTAGESKRLSTALIVNYYCYHAYYANKTMMKTPSDKLSKTVAKPSNCQVRQNALSHFCGLISVSTVQHK